MLLLIRQGFVCWNRLSHQFSSKRLWFERQTSIVNQTSFCSS